MEHNLFDGQYARVLRKERAGIEPRYIVQVVRRDGTGWDGTGEFFVDPDHANAVAYHQESLVHEALGQLTLFS